MTTTAPPRPKVTDDMVRDAATRLLNDYGQDEDQADDIVEHYHHWIDGYELAKNLDMYCHWSIDAQTVEMLADLPGRVDRILDKAKKEWVKAYNIQPKLKNGTQIKRGVIAGVYEHGAAEYLVKENGCTKENRFLIVPFEEAEVAAQPN